MSESIEDFIKKVGPATAYHVTGKMLRSMSGCLMSEEDSIRLWSERVWLADMLATEYTRLCGVGTSASGTSEAFRALFDARKEHNICVIEKEALSDTIRGYLLLAQQTASDGVVPDAAFVALLRAFDSVSQCTPKDARAAFAAYNRKRGV